jgi:putative tricarboxylic transport membrane protein
LRRGWEVACVVLLVFFLAALVVSFGYSLTDALGPGPGFFPFWLSLVGLVLVAAMLIEVWRGRIASDDGKPLLPSRSAALQSGSVLVALAAALVLLEPVGFRLTMALFIAALLPALGARSAIAIVLCAAVGSFGVFHVFYYWLKVPLPIGMLGI